MSKCSYLAVGINDNITLVSAALLRIATNGYSIEKTSDAISTQNTLAPTR